MRRAVCRAVCPGSFDPPTNGHLDIIERASRLFDEVVVAVGVNASKSKLFTPDERMDLLRRATQDLPNVRIDGFEGLLTDYCEANDIAAIVKGLRGADDLAYELAMAQMNASLTSAVQTVFVPTAPEHGFVSSSLLKEVATYGGDVAHLVPDIVLTELLARLRERSTQG